ncbi:MAG TPA: c-type cytochrome [Candidatus Acidoferrales bacterium]|nr:c-type cytochrome [Candidatus Acidoferrales bacterium]
MDRAERTALVLAGVLMVVFFAALVYSAAGLNISVPTCVTDVAPFKEGKVIDKGNNHYEVHMVAKMWAFDPPEVRLPPGAEVDFYLSALDVTHGMYIEHTNVNLMAVPGTVNAVSARFDKEGQYDVICHEYCGVGHQNMMGKIVIAKGAVVAPWAPPPIAASALASAQLGQRLFEANGCPACHTTDGSPGVGPTVKGIFGREVELTTERKITADDAYLERSIRDPNAEVVAGFQPLMPLLPLSDADVKALVAYLKTLS